MANRFQKFIYYISAEAPVLIILAILWLYEKSIWKKPIVISWKVPCLLLAMSTALVVIFNSFFEKAKTNLSIMELTGVSYRSADGWLIAYVVTYLLPLASIALGDIIWFALLVVLIVLMIALVFSDFITPHPLLFCKGYHFYKLDVEGSSDEYIIISKKRIRKVKDFKKASRVFEFLLIRKG